MELAARFVYYHKYHKAVILCIVKILDIVIPLVKWNSNIFFNHLSPFVYIHLVLNALINVKVIIH